MLRASLCRWSLAAATALLILVWIGSRWWSLVGGLGPFWGFVQSGGLGVGYIEDGVRPHLMIAENTDSGRFWWWFDDQRGGASPDFIIPLWLFIAAAGSAAVLSWMRRAAPQSSGCEACGYDLRGNVSGRCPECGRPTEAANQHPAAMAEVR